MGRAIDKLKTFYKSTLAFFVISVLVLSTMAPLAKVLADAPDPVIPFGGVITTDGSGHPVFTLSGNWQWTTHFDNKGDGSKDCNQDRYAAGYAIDWHDATQPGNLVQNGSIIAHVGTPTDNNVHYIHLAGDPDPTGDPTGATRCGVYAQHGVDSHGHPIFYNTGNWGPISHTYPIGTTTFSACVVTYDVHNTNIGNLTAGGAGHNGDNSVEKNGSTPLGNGCFSANVPPTLNLTKSVTNDNGGTKTPADWTLTASGTDGFSDTGDSTTFHQVDAGVTYSLSESNVAGYAATGDYLCNGGVQNGNTITLSAGQNVTCTIVNDDIAPTLTVIKDVTNDNGGTATADQFKVKVNGTQLTGGTLSNSNHTDTYTYPSPMANTAYTVSEDSFTGYSQTGLLCTDNDTHTTVSNPVTLNLGQHVTCIITNDDVAPSLTVSKHVNNNHGGGLGSFDFPLYVDSTQVTNGQTYYTFKAGSHTVSEMQQSGYHFVGVDGSSDCTYDSNTDTISLTMSLGGTYTCILINEDIAPTLTVVKNVINDNSGTKKADGFTVKVNGTALTGGTLSNGDLTDTYTFNNPMAGTAYTVSEDSAVGYTQDSLVCKDNDTHATVSNPVTLALAQNVTCTITNNDNPNPAIQVVKDGPATAHEGDTVTYTFDVTNVGDTQTLSNITVSDNVAGLGNFQGGDTDSDGLLDKGEVWHYTKDYTIPTPQTADVVNKVKACGYYGNTKVCDKDYHHLDVIHPAIHVVKSGPSTAFAGDTVTYEFDVTNTGDTPLDGLTVNDNVAGIGNFQSGDTNSDGNLDLGETWIYTKQFTIPSSQTTDITNTVTACGSDSLQLQVCDTDDHTTTVLNPGIHVVKTGPSSAAAGSTVTYTFTVTNTGNTPLSNLTVQDNIAGNAAYQSGDTNSNNMLDTTETWIYTANYTIPAGQFDSITNTVTACGDPQQRVQILALTTINHEVCATDNHTLVIPKVLAESTPPELVNTGQSALTGIIAGLTIISLVGATTLVTRKEQ